MHIRDDTVPEIQVAIGFETFPANHKHSFTLGVLQQLIGEWHTHSLAGTFISFKNGDRAFSDFFGYAFGSGF
jgi:hypothetical protein